MLFALQARTGSQFRARQTTGFCSSFLALTRASSTRLPAADAGQPKLRFVFPK